MTEGPPAETGVDCTKPREPKSPAGSPPRARRWGRWLSVGLLLAGLLLLGAWVAVAGRDLLQHGRSLVDRLDALEQLAQGGPTSLGIADVERAGQHLAAIRRDLDAIQARVGTLVPAGRLLGWVPVHGGDLAAADDLLQIVVGVVTAGDRVFQALSPALASVDTGDGAGNPLALGQELLPLLAAALPDLEAAQRDLGAVAQSRARIDASTLSPRVAGLVERLDGYLPWLYTAVDAALLAPQFLGADGPRTYLIVAQNNHELRPTGGFISGVGELTIDQGRLASLSFSDSYAVDNLSVPHETPPLDFQHILMGEIWLFRDTNWDADFPTSARRAMEVYARDRGVQADGLVALDLTGLELLLGALGPVRVEGFSDPVTAQNVLEALQEQWANPEAGPGYEGVWDPEWWAHRKDFMGQVASAGLSKLLSGQGIEPAALLRALMQALDAKHLLVYASDPEVAEILRNRNWDGALPEPFGLSDLLAVVDTNVGFNKADPNVERSIRYEVDLTREGQAQATLTLTYHNRSRRSVDSCIQEARYGEAYADMMDRCYWDYLRVYAPLGSRLLAGPTLHLPPGSLLARSGKAPKEPPISRSVSEGDWTAWPLFFDLAPGSEATFTFAYELPVGVLHADAAGLLHYRLRVPKQPGTIATPLQVQVTLPPDAELVDTAPAGLFLMQGSSAVATTDLGIDREFDIVFATDGSEP